MCYSILKNFFRWNQEIDNKDNFRSLNRNTIFLIKKVFVKTQCLFLCKKFEYCDSYNFVKRENLCELASIEKEFKTGNLSIEKSEFTKNVNI